MYEFLPPLAKYALLVALYVFLVVMYRGLWRAGSPAPQPATSDAPPAARPTLATLTVISAGTTSVARVGAKVPLLAANMLGRSPEATCLVEDQFASKRHCLVEFDRGVYVLTDLGSRNGTLVNGRPMTGSVQLADGDRIEIGSTVFEFRC